MDIGLSAVAAALLLGGIWLFNRLVSERNTVKQAWSDIGVQLKRRHDLIPKLVEAVKVYSGYEQATLARVTELRTAAQRAARPGEAGPLERALTGALHELIAVAEAYPGLKASESYLALMRDVTAVERDIQHARRYYNGAVKQYNVRVESVPSNAVAAVFRFVPAEYFDADAP
jgi:LemA protein